MAHLRQFGTGATRDEGHTKPDYEGYLSPTVIQRYGEYMLAHQQTPEGMRESDNWQLGIPLDEYMKSLWRHFHALWLWHRTEHGDPEESLCAMLFNVSGYLHELLKVSLQQPHATREGIWQADDEKGPVPPCNQEMKNKP